MEKKASKKWIVYVVVGIIILAVAGYLIVPRVIARSAAANAANYQTEAVTRVI